jgi:hypothetical protein
MTSRNRDRGQAAVLTVVFMTVLLGMAAAVLDVGSWYRADRQLQATVDAAALAGAQALPEDAGAAKALASEYGDKNGGGVTEVAFSLGVLPNDTISVKGERAAQGFFTKLFGISSVDVHGAAKARTGVLGEAKYVAPITVSLFHPMLACTPPPCSDSTEVVLEHKHKPGTGDAAGSFGLLDLREGGGGTAGSSEVSSWMADGYDAYMPLGVYESVPSTMFNSVQFRNALTSRLNTEVLFPIYKPPVVESGSNAEYDIVGWVGFVPSKFTTTGDGGKVYGSFKRVIWEGISTESALAVNMGAYAVSLVE